MIFIPEAQEDIQDVIKSKVAERRRLWEDSFSDNDIDKRSIEYNLDKLKSVYQVAFSCFGHLESAYNRLRTEYPNDFSNNLLEGLSQIRQDILEMHKIIRGRRFLSDILLDISTDLLSDEKKDILEHIHSHRLVRLGYFGIHDKILDQDLEEYNFHSKRYSGYGPFTRFGLEVAPVFFDYQKVRSKLISEREMKVPFYETEFGEKIHSMYINPSVQFYLFMEETGIKSIERFSKVYSMYHDEWDTRSTLS